MDSVRIENWSVVVFAEDPDPKPLYFHGILFGHPNVNDGTVATTSRILSYREADQAFVCHSRYYTLGTMDPEWNQKQPGVSLEKLIENLPRA